MQQKSSNRKKQKFGWIRMRYEVILMLVIVICISYMTMYEEMVHRYTAISVSPRGNIAILHNKDDMDILTSYNWPIIKFHHDSTQFVIIYTPDQEEVNQLMLGDVVSLYEKIDHIKDWWYIFNSNPNGGTINLDEDEINMTINYEWLYFDDGSSYLMVYNTDHTIDYMLNTYNIVSYTTIILSFIMLASILYRQYHELISTYRKLNVNLQEIITLL